MASSPLHWIPCRRKCDLSAELVVIQSKEVFERRILHTLSLRINADEIHYANSQHICIQLDGLLVTKIPFVGLVDNHALAVDDSVAWYNAFILWIVKLQISRKLRLQGAWKAQSIIMLFNRPEQTCRETSRCNPADPLAYRQWRAGSSQTNFGYTGIHLVCLWHAPCHREALKAFTFSPTKQGGVLKDPQSSLPHDQDTGEPT